MSKLVVIEMATGVDISPITDEPSGYAWTKMAIDPSEVASILEGTRDERSDSETCEVFLRGQKPNKDGEIRGRILKGSLDYLLDLFNGARS